MTAAKPRILVATANRGKLAEFQRLLGNSYQVEGLEGRALQLPAEGEISYRENAQQKASFVAAATGLPTLGDDSGIEVTALGGRPGIRSARFSGEPVSDERNVDRLLFELHRSGSVDRSARFVCWLALATETGLVASAQGICEGIIGDMPRGENGFGYDPIFVLPDGRTMAQLTDEHKDRISHRGNAIRAMLSAIDQEFKKGSGSV